MANNFSKLQIKERRRRGMGGMKYRDRKKENKFAKADN